MISYAFAGTIAACRQTDFDYRRVVDEAPNADSTPTMPIAARLHDTRADAAAGGKACGGTRSNTNTAPPRRAYLISPSIFRAAPSSAGFPAFIFGMMAATILGRTPAAQTESRCRFNTPLDFTRCRRRRRAAAMMGAPDFSPPPLPNLMRHIEIPARQKAVSARALDFTAPKTIRQLEGMNFFRWTRESRALFIAAAGMRTLAPRVAAPERYFRRRLCLSHHFAIKHGSISRH